RLLGCRIEDLRTDRQRDGDDEIVQRIVDVDLLLQDSALSSLHDDAQGRLVQRRQRQRRRACTKQMDTRDARRIHALDGCQRLRATGDLQLTLVGPGWVEIENFGVHGRPRVVGGCEALQDWAITRQNLTTADGLASHSLLTVPTHRNEEKGMNQALPRRTLGREGLTVSAIGLGCMGMSDFYGDADEATNLAVLNHALDIGVNFLDTADMYGVGRNEMLLGKVLKTRRDEIVLATKFGNVRAPDGAFLGVNGRPEYVAQACDASLTRLGVDHIDLYYQHRVDPRVPIEDTVGAMARLVEAGKVRY